MGEWRTAEISYLRTYRVHCELCGQLVPARYWSAQMDGRDATFCNAAHERLYHSYWLPIYGRQEVV
jgi:hypothetical protein